MAIERKVKRKIWFSRLIIFNHPGGLISGSPTTGGETDAAKEIKTSSPWKAGKTKNKYGG